MIFLPLSTGMTAPLIYVTTGSARATSTFATSSVVVMRPPGLRLSGSAM